MSVEGKRRFTDVDNAVKSILKTQKMHRETEHNLLQMQKVSAVATMATYVLAKVAERIGRVKEGRPEKALLLGSLVTFELGQMACSAQDRADRADGIIDNLYVQNGTHVPQELRLPLGGGQEASKDDDANFLDGA